MGEYAVLHNHLVFPYSARYIPKWLDKALASCAELSGLITGPDNFFGGLNTSISLAAAIPADRIIVSESGIQVQKHIENVERTAGIHAFLIGETLMRSDDMGASCATFGRQIKN